MAINTCKNKPGSRMSLNALKEILEIFKPVSRQRIKISSPNPSRSQREQKGKRKKRNKISAKSRLKNRR